MVRVVRVVESGELDDYDGEHAVRGRRRRVLRVWLWTMVIALVGIAATLLLAALFWADLRSSIFDNNSQALPAEARSRLEQVRSSRGFAATPDRRLRDRVVHERALVLRLVRRGRAAGIAHADRGSNRRRLR